MAFFVFSLQPVKTPLYGYTQDVQSAKALDRYGEPLSVTFQTRWNTSDILPLYEVPVFLKEAFVFSEDKRFFGHKGIDWQARMSALQQNFSAWKAVRGASTITEQVVRIVNPRPRTLWSKALETAEALLLEQKIGKAEILEFYLNQLPYASNRRGVEQAARYYFNRDVSTLTKREMLALVVLARAPSAYDLYKNAEKAKIVIDKLAMALRDAHVISAQDYALIQQEQLPLEVADLPAEADHFVRFVKQSGVSAEGPLKTTLDGRLQKTVQKMMNERVKNLSAKNVHNGAALVVDYTTGDILAWVVAGAGDKAVPAHQIDAVTVARQPGSALKPFLYSAALDKGWSPATLLNDSPLAEAIGTGVHHFRNYSNIHYGKISLREALANSLNIPAVLTIQYVGTEKYLKILHKLGFKSLTRGAEVYDEGLALGDGEVTLLEMVRAYAALANKGRTRPLRYLQEADEGGLVEQVYTPESSSLIANILSDRYARRLEFGEGSVLNLPSQTAAKTGTSTDYRDAWTFGFNNRYVVGVWMGNLDRTPMDGVTGSTGPALVWRGIFNELTKISEPSALWLSPKLVQREICLQTVDTCYRRTEYFMSNDVVTDNKPTDARRKFELVHPTDGLQIAVDPRVPLDYQKLEFNLKGLERDEEVAWILDDAKIAQTDGRYLWELKRGRHRLLPKVLSNNALLTPLPSVTFMVK